VVKGKIELMGQKVIGVIEGEVDEVAMSLKIVEY
jgi:hypothetical protein